MKRGGFAGAALLLVDISKVKLLKGNSTSKTNRKWALGWLTEGSGVCVCVCVPGVCYSLKISFSTERVRDPPVCLYWSCSASLAKSRHFFFFCFVNKKNCVRVSGSDRLHFLTWQLHTWLSFWAPWSWPDWFQWWSTWFLRWKNERHKTYCRENPDKHNYVMVLGK